ATTVLLLVLEESLRLLHPFLPFVTEEIYGMLPNSRGRLISQPWPKRDDTRLNPELAARFDSLRELVTLARTLRSEFQIPPEARMPLEIRFGAGFVGADFMKRGGSLIALLVNGPEPCFLEKDAARPAGTVALIGKGFELFVDVKELVDTAKLVAKLDKDIQKESAFVAKVQAKLTNQSFVASAPAEIVAQERQKCAEAESKVVKLRHYIEELS
ncbi:MAG: class I tRNA ligase family protein, partial [Rectinemataceae bacterium]